mmetsp:Transcript_100681/g.215801  ORF Transcript_100681/g.215801 Transcript_100681/m.215801 type:complete len:298 (+) Transcript_100681:787-1680(+)
MGAHSMARKSELGPDLAAALSAAASSAVTHQGASAPEGAGSLFFLLGLRTFFAVCGEGAFSSAASLAAVAGAEAGAALLKAPGRRALGGVGGAADSSASPLTFSSSFSSSESSSEPSSSSESPVKSSSESSTTLSFSIKGGRNLKLVALMSLTSASPSSCTVQRSFSVSYFPNVPPDPFRWEASPRPLSQTCPPLRSGFMPNHEPGCTRSSSSISHATEKMLSSSWYTQMALNIPWKPSLPLLKPYSSATSPTALAKRAPTLFRTAASLFSFGRLRVGLSAFRSHLWKSRSATASRI